MVDLSERPWCSVAHFSWEKEHEGSYFKLDFLTSCTFTWAGQLLPLHVTYLRGFPGTATESALECWVDFDTHLVWFPKGKRHMCSNILAQLSGWELGMSKTLNPKRGKRNLNLTQLQILPHHLLLTLTKMTGLWAYIRFMLKKLFDKSLTSPVSLW